MSAPPAEAWYTQQPAYAPQQGYQQPPDYATHQGYPPHQGYAPPQQGYPPPQAYPPPQGYPPQNGYPPQAQPLVASYQSQPLPPAPGTLPPLTTGTTTTVQYPSSNVIVVTTSAAPSAAQRPNAQRRPAQRPPARRPPAPQKVVRNVQEGVQPPDHMVYAIIVTIFCCLPCGIVALMRSSSVRSRFASGDYEGAQRSSLSAKRWSNTGLICGTIFDIILAIFLLFVYVILPAFAGLAS